MTLKQAELRALGYTRRVYIDFGAMNLDALIRPETDTDGSFKAFDVANNEWLVVNGWMMASIEDSPPETIEQVSTDKLQTGDKVLSHGRVFELTDRNQAEGRTDHNLVGPSRPVIWFHTRLIETRDAGGMPDSWAADWTIQGNYLAIWTRVVTE